MEDSSINGMKILILIIAIVVAFLKKTGLFVAKREVFSESESDLESLEDEAGDYVSVTMRPRIERSQKVNRDLEKTHVRFAKQQKTHSRVGKVLQIPGEARRAFIYSEIFNRKYE